MKKKLESLLYLLSKAILQRYKPEIIGITGSVGKTSAKEAIFTVLSAKYSTKEVRRNIKNYNNEIGVPLTIIGAETGNRNIFKWFFIFLKALWMIVGWVKYPKILVLEMGADKPGDLKYLTELAPCKVGVVTVIGEKSPVHIEFFKDKAQLVKEKMRVLNHLDNEGWAIVNIDDPEVKKASSKIKAQTLTIGVAQEADLYAAEVQMTEHLAQLFDDRPTGLTFKIIHQGNTVPFFLPQVLGLPQVYAALIAAAVGICFEMNLVEISEALKDYQPPKGRLNVIPGIKQTAIIDDSYNSSPIAVKEALSVMSRVKSDAHKIACLGDMAELGVHTEKEHQEIGQLINDLNLDYLFTVGESARMIANAAQAAGMDKDHVFEFQNAEEAGKFTQERMQKGDIVLVKGSQSVRMEKIVKEIMAEPKKAEDLLVRQGKIWENR